ncbi:hypothetical protein ALC56_03894 [Trachymyrmex septentrionalis]|uniref:Double jelly roll-like domain-containing protein n=1 Tax=Trachymyrmex septentrionalis TaxID=34720 RepID=A0A151JYZ1_9HYME|nr:hypothetical protein ALC56_03894 [Trachymyrmex septentrionalis]
MNNAIFGKTMENVRNHVNVKLLTKWNRRYCMEAMIKFMYTDTDSLIRDLVYRVDDYETMKRDIARFDTSDYPTDNVYNMLLAKKVPSLKDENNGAIMTEFVGLRAKMCAMKVDCKKDTKKVIGVKSNVECYPYDDLNLDFDKNRCAILYDLYARFCKGYYGYEYLTFTIFLCNVPFVIIDCSQYNPLTNVVRKIT